MKLEKIDFWPRKCNFQATVRRDAAESFRRALQSRALSASRSPWNFSKRDRVRNKQLALFLEISHEIFKLVAAWKQLALVTLIEETLIVEICSENMQNIYRGFEKKLLTLCLFSFLFFSFFFFPFFIQITFNTLPTTLCTQLGNCKIFRMTFGDIIRNGATHSTSIFTLHFKIPLETGGFEQSLGSRSRALSLLTSRNARS